MSFVIFSVIWMLKKLYIVVLKSLGKKNQQSKTMKQEQLQRLNFFEFNTQNEIFSAFTFWVIKKFLTVAQAKESKYSLWTKPTQCVPFFGCKLTIEFVDFLPLLVLICLAMLGSINPVDQINDKMALYAY